MTSSSPDNVQSFHIHYPEGHRAYICVVDRARRAFDFTDNTFKFANELSRLPDACLYASGSPEPRADHHFSYSVQFDLARLLAGRDAATVPDEGDLVCVHWLLQIGEEPDVDVDNRLNRVCQLRLLSGAFEPMYFDGREMVDENISFEKRAVAEREYGEFVLREIDAHDRRLNSLDAAVRAGDVALTLRGVADDLCSWALSLKDHLLHYVTHLAKDPSFVRMLDVPEGAPFHVIPTWAVREWVGSREAFDLLEFHKNAEYAQSFAARLDRLNEARIEFGRAVNEYMIRHHGEDLDGIVALDEARKDLKHMAIVHAEHLDRIAAQFDAARNLIPSHTQPASTPASSNPPTTEPQVPVESLAPQPFKGGEIAFFADRVELCGVEICRGPRSQTRRQLLELLGTKEASGAFKSYSGEELAKALWPKGGQGTVAGPIRDLRDEIMAALRTKGNMLCGRKDVILSGGPGYRFADNITVGHGDQVGNEVADADAEPDVADTCLVLDAPDDPAGGRQAWILEQLADGAQLKAPDVARHFKCSVKTAQRDLIALRDEGKIEFVGAARTGYYCLRQRSGEQA